MARFELSNTFLELERHGAVARTRWGLGAALYEHRVTFPTELDAQQWLEQLANEKRREGYAERPVTGLPLVGAAPADEEPELQACSLERAVALTGMSEAALAEWGIDADSSILLVEGDLRSPSDGTVPEDGLLIVTGSIDVAGTLWQQEGALVVRGGVKARHFVTGGWSLIAGPILLEGVLYGDSRCDRTMDFNVVKASAVIDHGHTFIGRKHALTILALEHGGGLTEPDTEPDALRSVLVDEVLDEEGYLDAEALFWRLVRGEAVLRPGASPRPEGLD